jgi:CPA1 family monovalent cation:H+ antiporter
VKGFETLLGLLFASALLAALARRMRLPVPIVMVLGGVAAAFAPVVRELAIDPDVAFAVFVPPLLFRAATTTSVREIRDHVRSVALLAVGLVLATTVVVAAAARYAIPGIAWPAAFVLGAVLSPPDAVVSIALARALKVHRTLVSLVEGEGLLNDTTAFVVYGQAVRAVVTGRFSLARAIPEFFLVGLGGAAVGFAAYFVVSRLRTISKDPIVLNVIWLLTPFAAFLPAERIGASGVLAVVVAGVLLRRWSSLAVAAETRITGQGVFDVLEFILNSLMFILIGMQVGAILRDPSAPPLLHVLRVTAVVTGAVVVSRFAWMFPSAYLPRVLSARVRKREGMPPASNVALLAWMGIRGGDSLVTALALPTITAAGAPFPNRALLVATTFGVILATMLLQGLTLAPLIKWMRLPVDHSLDGELALARRKMVEASDAWLRNIAEQGNVSGAILERVRGHYTRKAQLELDLDGEGQGRATAETYRRLEQGLLAERRRAAVSLRDDRVIDDEVLGRLERDLDLEELRITPEEESPG